MARGETAANGFNWNAETQECRGVIDADVIDTKQTKWKTCIFTGKFLVLQNYLNSYSHSAITSVNLY